MSSENRIRNRTTQIGIAPQGGEVQLIDMSAQTWDRRIHIAQKCRRLDELMADRKFDAGVTEPVAFMSRREMNTWVWAALGLLERT